MREKLKGLGFLLMFIVILSLFGFLSSINGQMPSTSEIGQFTVLNGSEPEHWLSSVSHDLTNTTELEEFMDEIMNEHLETYKIPGATVVVVKNDTTLLAKGYGFADIAQQKPVIANQTLFRIASVSKLFTWTAVMQLWEQGKVDLNEDVNSYLTTFQLPATYPEPITLNHLMTHSAGFEDRIIGEEAYDPEGLKSLAEHCATKIPARVRPPGELPGYSNYGADLAGYIVELVSGIPFAEYIEEYIYKPLGMTQSTFRQPIPSEIIGELTEGYSLAHNDGTFDVLEFEYLNGEPSGTMSATATDIAKFMIAHLQNGSYGNSRILEETTAQKMHTRSFSADPRVNGFAHGWQEKTVNGQRLIVHGGDLNAFHSLLELSLEHNMGLFVSYNNPNGISAREKLLHAFMDLYYPASVSPTPEPLPDHKARVNRFVGTYRMTRAIYTTAFKIGYDLIAALPISADTDGRLVVSELVKTLLGYHYFVEVEPMVFYPLDEEGNIVGDDFLVFWEDNQGQITHFFANNIPIMAFEKLGWFEEPFFHMGMLIFCFILFLAALLLEPITFAVRKLRKKSSSPDSVSHSPDTENPVLHWLIEHGRSITSWLSASTSGLFVLFGVLFLYLVTQITAFVYGVPLVVYLIFSLPLLAALLTGLMTFFVGIAWKEHYWDWYKRTFHTLVLVACFAFLLELNYWHLLGFNF
ncbi:MAG: serine hydrolase domain-containing protein [Promethearchaeota archaeon]